MSSCSLITWLNSNSGAGTLAQWLSAMCALAALTLGIISAFWATKEWRAKHVVEDWGKTLTFLFDHSKYLDPLKNADYKASYQGDELIRYELVARRSIAYVDDVFHLELHDKTKEWLKGSVNVFVRPHQKWFLDHPQDYSDEFLKHVKAELGLAAA